jgi:predicted transcriptional regulator
MRILRIMMRLLDYLRVRKMKPIEFAALSGISLATLYRYLKGGTPSEEIAYKIETATNNMVKYERSKLD